MSVLLVSTWINIGEGGGREEGHRHSGPASIPLGGVLPLTGFVPVGSGDGVGDCDDVANLPRVRLFISLFLSFFCGTNFTLFLRV